MTDYDVIVIGGGINGLTSAAYLSRAGLKTLVLEARGECGCHCDTVEPGIPGFRHNLHATWLISAMSPAMGDLELQKYGLEHCVTDYVYAKTFEDRKNILLGVNPFDTVMSWEKLSKKDAEVLMKAGELLLTETEGLTSAMHDYIYGAPSVESKETMRQWYQTFLDMIDQNFTFDDLMKMNGFEATSRLFESEYTRTMLQSLAWIGGLPPIHPEVGSVGAAIFGLVAGPIFPIHQAIGGSHSLTHSLVRAATDYGATIWPSCPVKKIIVKNNAVQGVQLSEHAIYANQTITAKKIISDVTVVPTFIDLIGEDVIGTNMAGRIKKFEYDEQNLIGAYFALDQAPTFASAEYDDGIQRCFMGYFGGENTKALENFNKDLVKGVIHENLAANWFIPTLTDPSQAPEGGHTAFVWLDVPPAPKSWKKGQLQGIASWDQIKDEMADDMTDLFEKYAPGFKNLIKERIVYTPLDMQRNNMSAIKGNWVGGSVIPSQWYMNRPVPGVLKGGGSRSFLKNFYLSNSIHPFGATWLASGYIAATEVAEDMGAREQSWWQDKACRWYLDNINDIPLNLGVR